MIADHDVVADMAAGQDVIVRADHGGLAVARGAVDGDAFADGIVIADLGARQAALPFQILGPEPDGGEGKDLVLLPEPRVAIDHHMRMQPAARPQLHVLADDAIRPDLAIGPDLRLGMDDCG